MRKEFKTFCEEHFETKRKWMMEKIVYHGFMFHGMCEHLAEQFIFEKFGIDLTDDYIINNSIDYNYYGIYERLKKWAEQNFPIDLLETNW